jgi:hypothetical protein
MTGIILFLFHLFVFLVILKSKILNKKSTKWYQKIEIRKIT